MPLRPLAHRSVLLAQCLTLTLLCLTADAQTKIYWTDGSAGPKIQRANVDGSDVETIVPFTDLIWNNFLPWIWALAVDPGEAKIYWVGDYFSEGRLQRANLDGTDQEILIEAGLRSPTDITLDLNAQKMYWTDFASIQRSNLDGSDVEEVVDSSAGAFSIALDPFTRKIYWTSGNSIKRADHDGNNIEILIQGIDVTQSPLAIDPSGRRMFWIEGNAAIFRARLNGSDVEQIGSSPPVSLGLTLDLSEDKIYWTSFSDSRFWRANLDGSDMEIMPSIMGVTIGIALDAPSRGVPLSTSGRATLYALVVTLLVLGAGVSRSRYVRRQRSV